MSLLSKSSRFIIPFIRPFIGQLSSPLTLRVVFTSIALIVCVPSSAAPKSVNKDNTTRSPRCSYGIAQDGTNNCMSKAEYDITASRQNVLDADPAQYMRNALVRCDSLKGDDQKDCLSRIRGGGTVSGSVEGGGLYRELVTIIPGKPAEESPKARAD
jgi:uncharacterized membrane protein